MIVDKKAFRLLVKTLAAEVTFMAGYGESQDSIQEYIAEEICDVLDIREFEDDRDFEAKTVETY